MTRASSTMRGTSSAVAGRLASTSAELRDLAEDRVAPAVVGLVAADGLERLAVEAVQALDHLRRRELVVVRDGQGVGGRYVGLPRRVGRDGGLGHRRGCACGRRSRAGR